MPESQRSCSITLNYMNSCVLHTGFRLDWALGCIQIQKMHLSLIPISLSQWGCIYVQQAVGFHTCQQHTPLIHSYEPPQDEVMRQLAANVSCVKFVRTFHTSKFRMECKAKCVFAGVIYTIIGAVFPMLQGPRKWALGWSVFESFHKEMKGPSILGTN